MIAEGLTWPVRRHTLEVMAKLTTERLSLRPFRRSDAQVFAQLAGDWEVACMTSDIPYPLSAEQAMLWMKPVRGEVRYGIVHEGRLIGGVGFYRRPTGSAELGFWLGRPWWGRGFASEAARAVVAQGFARHKVPMFTSAHFVDNAASRGVLLKLGFQRAAECRIACAARGQEVATVTYWLDEPHWAASNPAVNRESGRFERVRDLLAWARRAFDRPKTPSSRAS